MVCCVHHIPGRARFKIETLRRDPKLAEMIHEQVGALEGVTSVEINRHAASIIVYYSADVGGIDTIVDHICAHCPKSSLNRRIERDAPEFTGEKPAAPPPKVAHALRDAVSKAVVSTFINRALEQSISGLVIGPR